MKCLIVTNIGHGVFITNSIKPETILVFKCAARLVILFLMFICGQMGEGKKKQFCASAALSVRNEF